MLGLVCCLFDLIYLDCVGFNIGLFILWFALIECFGN